MPRLIKSNDSFLFFHLEKYDPDWNTFVEYYNILGVDSSVSEEQVRRAYHQLSLKWHPDKNPGCSECNEKYLKIQDAYHKIQKYGSYYKAKRAIQLQHIPTHRTQRKENNE
jgi:preprotein translocase subunit Sec63